MHSSEQVAPNTKQVLHETVHRQEALRVSDRLEPSHLALALASRLVSLLVRNFGAIVGVLARAVNHRPHDPAMRCRVACP